MEKTFGVKMKMTIFITKKAMLLPNIYVSFVSVMCKTLNDGECF